MAGLARSGSACRSATGRPATARAASRWPPYGPTGDLLAGYHADVHALTLRYLEPITADELERVVDTRWDPPVTASARLVSVLGDAYQHLGQAAYVDGLRGSAP